MKRSLSQLMCVLVAAGLGAPGEADGGAPHASSSRRAVRALFAAADWPGPADQDAAQQLLRAFEEHGSLVTGSGAGEEAWVTLSFDRFGRLASVAVDAERLLGSPPLVQRAVLLHEVEHLKHAQDTRWLIDGALARWAAASGEPGVLGRRERVARLRDIVRVLVDDESRACRRDLLFVQGAVDAAGGLPTYLSTLPASQQAVVAQYYERRVRPFVTAAGGLDEGRLRQVIFLGTFPRRYPRYYEAVLLSEVLEGSLELEWSADGAWRPSRVRAPERFLAWLAPST